MFITPRVPILEVGLSFEKDSRGKINMLSLDGKGICDLGYLTIFRAAY